MKFWQYLRVIFTAGFVILWNHFRYMLRFAKHPERYPFEYRYKIAQKVIRTVFEAFHIDYRNDGLEKYLSHDGKCVIVANHLSDVDPLALVAISDRPLTFVSKKEAFKFPFIGTYLKALSAVKLDRQNLMDQLKSIDEIVKRAKDPNEPDIVIFAEGTRNKNPGTPCLEFKGGTIRMGMKAEVAIIPVAIYGTFRVFDMDYHLKKYPCFFHFLDPIEPSQYENSKSVELATSIQASVDERIKILKQEDYRLVSEQKMSPKKLAKSVAPDLIK